MSLTNPEYDEQVMQQIANESETFRILLEGMVQDTDSDSPTNKVWIGTLVLGTDKVNNTGSACCYSRPFYFY